MSQATYPMTDESLAARLERFKMRVDGAIQSALEFEPVEAALVAVNYRKRGGLHFATIAGANVSWSFRKKAKTKTVESDLDESAASAPGCVDLNSPHMAQRYATFVKMPRE